VHGIIAGQNMRKRPLGAVTTGAQAVTLGTLPVAIAAGNKYGKEQKARAAKTRAENRAKKLAAAGSTETASKAAPRYYDDENRRQRRLGQYQGVLGVGGAAAAGEGGRVGGHGAGQNGAGLAKETYVAIRVLLVDDQPLLRTGFRMILEAEQDIAVVGEAGDGLQALDQVRALQPDVVLMDIRMPRMDGVEATRQITGPGRDGPAKVLVLTTFDLDEYVFAAVRAGASGFLTKDASAEELATAIRAVHAGDAVLAPRATASLVDFVAQAPGPVDAETLLEPFTAREREVLSLHVTGASNDDIAARLYLTVNTVKTHVKAILAKLELPDRVHVIIWAYEHGLVAG
jgi:DNA-binding NarL/FixJ family response regulator